MKIQKFEDLIAWQKSQDLVVCIYSFSNPLKDYAFKDQIRRASISISNNIAEGFERRSKPDFIRFLYFSLASCSEVKSMLYLAERLEYIPTKTKNTLLLQVTEVSKILTGLIKSLA